MVEQLGHSKTVLSERGSLAFFRSSLALLAALAFAGSIGGALVWDDAAVVGVSTQRSLTQVLSADLFGNADSAAATANYYRPLVALAFHALRRLAPEQTWPLHALGLLAHAIASVLVFETVRRWLARSAVRAEVTPRVLAGVALTLAGILFIILH